MDMLENHLAALQDAFPLLFTEGKLDWEKMKLVFAPVTAVAEDRFTLQWAGKQQVFKTIQSPVTGTLEPEADRSTDFSNSKNIFIEGENLEVLKLLQKSYHRAVKCILIDPPYNTGSDSFVYPDNFSETKSGYQKQAGIKTADGAMRAENQLQRNSKDNGHFHSAWLSMMYPRLFLARNLLTKDGFIFVCIDDNEMHHLRILMNELFGEENFIACFPRITKKAGKTTDIVAKNNDYVLCYRRSAASAFNNYLHVDEGYKHSDEFESTRGKYKLSQALDYGSLQYSPSLDYEITLDGMVFRPGNATREEMEARRQRNPAKDYCWRWSKKMFAFGLDNGFIVVKKNKTGGRIYTKTYAGAIISENEDGYFVEELARTKPVTSLGFIENEFSNDNSRKDLAKIFSSRVFDYSKPVALLRELIFLSTSGHDLILDFFAGSGTTAQAVLEQNEADQQQRRFMLVQLPEPCDPSSEAFTAGYGTIADIARARINKSLEKSPANPGCRCFRHAPSNFKSWTEAETRIDNLEQQLALFSNPLKHDIAAIDLVVELMLDAGIPLDATLDKKNGYYIVNQSLLIVTAPLTPEIVLEIRSAGIRKVIIPDPFFEGDDIFKTNTLQQLESEHISCKTI